MNFDRSSMSLMDKRVREDVQHGKIGKVVQVYEHTNPTDDTNWEVDVELDGGNILKEYIPVLSPATETITAPKNGDKVFLTYGDEETKKPYAIQTTWTNEDRPPLGRAGMWRKVVESRDSPVGGGDLTASAYTQYEVDSDRTVASYEKSELRPDKSIIQIAKHGKQQNVTPTEQNELPAKVEFFDNPKEDKAWISVEINKEDGGDSDATWGMKFNIKEGTFSIVDPDGFGIEAHGDGDFTWHHKEIDFNEVLGLTGPLDL